jgi:prepilin signal peptidase PulO-like enzyme (type II secretory pathway)
MLWLCYEDISSMSVSLYGMVLFVLSVIFKGAEFNSTSFIIVCASMSLIFMFFYFYNKIFKDKENKSLIGFIDVFILVIVASLITYEKVPYFIFFCGAFSLIMHIIYDYLAKGKKAPFVPSIFLSYLLTSFKSP